LFFVAQYVNLSTFFHIKECCY